MKSATVLNFCLAMCIAAAASAEKTKTENFDKDPGWDGVNNRTAQTAEKATIKEDFGFSATNHAGGASAGEIGGFVSQAGEVAYYAMPIDTKSFNDELSFSGTFMCDDGGAHLQFGFFNVDHTNEWRTPNTLGLRLQGRGDCFYTYADYCTSKWRAGGQTFTESADRKSSRAAATKFPIKTSIKWTVKYDPKGNNGGGAITATMGEHTAVCELDATHKADGAKFNRFGIMNVMKSADKGGNMWFDDLVVNGKPLSFDADPKWEGKNNRKTWQSSIVRPRFDFGYSPTDFAGGKRKGELGGQIFRGDCRYPERMACYGAPIGPLTFDKPFAAKGKIAMRRGVTDSTALFGFYNSKESMRINESQNDGVPESCVAVHIEGPSSEGFLFYPVYRAKGGSGTAGRFRECPHIHPDGKVHDWTMKYDANGAGGKGQITITFDGKTNTLDLNDGDKARGTELDRFGIVTSWIDGNSEDVYWDDITYTVSQ